MCDLLPLRAIPSFLFSIIAYFMTGLARSTPQFFIFLITIFTASVFGAAVSFFISTLVSTFGKIHLPAFNSSPWILPFSRGFDHRRSDLRIHDDLQRFSRRIVQHLWLALLDTMDQCLPIRIQRFGNRWVSRLKTLSSEPNQYLPDDRWRRSGFIRHHPRHRLGSLEEFLCFNYDGPGVFHPGLYPITSD